MSTSSNKVRVATVGITVAALSLACVPAFGHSAAGQGQRPATREENIGVFAGAAVGAAAGGPIGAMVGIVAGALLGHHYHQQGAANHSLAARNQALSASLGRSEQEREGLAGQLDLATQSLASVRQQRAELDKRVQLSDDIEADVVFKTADASINEVELPTLREIGALAASLPPGAKVRIDGYADPRGPAALNDDLSLQRAESVALALEKAGCPQDRLVLRGHGASQSASSPADLDEYAFDRRVTVRLQGAPPVARSSGPTPEVAAATSVTATPPR